MLIGTLVTTSSVFMGLLTSTKTEQLKYFSDSIAELGFDVTQNEEF
jgi:hypothetical protein